MPPQIITFKGVTGNQMAMLAELLLYAYQEGNFALVAPPHDTKHDLNIRFENDDVRIQETKTFETVTWSVLKEENKDPSEQFSDVAPTGGGL